MRSHWKHFSPLILLIFPIVYGVIAAQRVSVNGTKVKGGVVSRLLPGDLQDVMDHKVELPSQTCQSPRKPQGLEYLGREGLTSNQKKLSGLGMCVMREFIYWNGEPANSTLPAVNAFNTWLANVERLGGRIEWQRRVDAGKLYTGLVFENKYYFIQFGNVSFDSSLIITSTKYIVASR